MFATAASLPGANEVFEPPEPTHPIAADARVRRSTASIPRWIEVARLRRSARFLIIAGVSMTTPLRLRLEGLLPVTQGLLNPP